MTWLLVVLVRLVIGSGAGTIATKKLADTLNSVDRFLFVYLVQALFSIVWALAFGPRLELSWTVFLVGVGNSFGTYCMWRAYALSVSRSSVFMIGDDLLALSLGYFFLGETRFLSPILAIGVGICIAACLMQGIYTVVRDRESQGSFKAIWLWAIGFSVPWGIADFFFGYSNLHAVPVSTFGLSYYLGSLIMAGIIWSARTRVGTEPALAPSLVMEVMLPVVILASINFGCFLLDYMAFGLAPITVVQPWLQVGGIVIPPIVGLLVFGERKALDLSSSLILIFAMVGASLIALSYTG